jgi:hypothetical protein
MARPLAPIVVLVVIALGVSDVHAGRALCIPGKKRPKCAIQMAKVTAVGDGDTVKVRIKRKRGNPLVRMTGIQAMELTRYGRRRAAAASATGSRPRSASSR